MGNYILNNLQCEAVEFSKQGKWHEAIEKNNRIIELDETNWMAWSRNAKCYREIGQIETAIEIYKYLHSIAPIKEHEFFRKKIEELETNAKYNKHSIKESGNVSYVYHLTNFEDFKKIMGSGKLLCRGLAQVNGATFSHNTELTASVLKHTDSIIKSYVRLALSSENPAFVHFNNMNCFQEHPSCEMRFSILKVSQLPQIRICDKVANRLSYTFDISNYSTKQRIEKLIQISKFDKAEVLIYREVPITCIEEVIIYCPKKLSYLIDDKSFINIRNITNSNAIIIELKMI